MSARKAHPVLENTCRLSVRQERQKQTGKSDGGGGGGGEEDHLLASGDRRAPPSRRRRRSDQREAVLETFRHPNSSYRGVSVRRRGNLAGDRLGEN